MKKIIAGITLAILSTACASGATSPERAQAGQATAEQAHAAIIAADTARAKADSVGYEWRDTEKLIKQARELMKDGKYSDAVAIAKTAEAQGNNAYTQWETESKKPLPQL